MSLFTDQTKEAHIFVEKPKKKNTSTNDTDTDLPSKDTSVTDVPKIDNTNFKDTSEGENLWNIYNDAVQKYNNKTFTYSNQNALDSVMAQILAGSKFDYDFNKDAFYHQYKDAYAKQARLASQDVMGQAAAMTGGYGNSYAASVGNQAYQAEIGKINDVIPELYQLALDRHNMTQDELYRKYQAYADDYSRQYNQYMGELSALADARDSALRQYGTAADEYYALQGNENANAWNEAQWLREQAWRNEDAVRNAVYSAQEYQKWLIENGLTQDPTTGEIVANGASEMPTAIINKMQNYATIDDWADFVASMVESGEIDASEADMYLERYEDEIGGKKLTDRNFSLVKDGNGNFLGLGINRNAQVVDEDGNEYTLAELRKELEKTMTRKEANEFIKELSNKLGIKN